MAEIPQWHVAGDWFDVCSCDIACPCIFGQPPTNNACRAVLAYRVREGHYGDVPLANLKLVLTAIFQGNIWAGQATGFKAALFVDSNASPQQQEGLQMIFSGQAGGIPARLSAIWGPLEMVGMEVAPIDFEVASDLAFLARGGAGQGSGARRGVDRTHDATGTARAAAERTRFRSGPWTNRDLGQGHDTPSRRAGTQMGSGRQVQQAHPVRLVGPSVLIAGTCQRRIRRAGRHRDRRRDPGDGRIISA